jgi:hypothetical protein
MGGQDGYARALLGYDINSDSIMTGFRFAPGKRFDLGLGVSWTQSQAAMNPFDLADQAAAFNATHASTVYDFSQTHTYSDLDTTRIDANVDARYKFSDDLWMTLLYRYADFEDDAPYLYDTSGSLDLYAVALGWKF